MVQVAILTMDFRELLQPAAIHGTTTVLPSPDKAAAGAVRPNAVVVYVDVDLLGDGVHVVRGVGSLAHRQGIAFFSPGPVTPARTLAATTTLTDDGELEVRARFEKHVNIQS